MVISTHLGRAWARFKITTPGTCLRAESQAPAGPSPPFQLWDWVAGNISLYVTCKGEQQGDTHQCRLRLWEAERA